MAQNKVDKLSGIHDDLANWCIQVLKGRPLRDNAGLIMYDEDAVMMIDPATPSEMNIVRQFLRDNNIDASPRAGNPLDILQGAMDLPFGDKVTPINRQIGE
jgi:hypothetical protein